MGRLPLYKDFTLPESTKCNNRGLLFDKFYDHWNPNWSLGTNKKNWLSKFTGLAGDSVLIEDFVYRRQLMVENLGGKLVFMRTDGRFVTGTGNEHPVENGFTWHPILGTPYIPGTTVKGFLRTWLAQQGQENLIADMFGSPETGVGGTVFFDALPVTPVKLIVDVMTPHYSQYYQGTAFPGDWQLPNPIPFLVVDTGQSFMFSFYHRDSGPGEILDVIENNLTEALDYLGAGAKTAVGYGRFVLDAREKEKYESRKELLREELRQKRELAQMSPIKREMLADGFEDDTMFLSKIERWLDRAEKSEGQDRRDIALALKGWYEQFRPGFYENPNKKNKERIERIKALL